ncbi:hypothetical protein OIDMADRAFT_157006 [Oidiodendron maius Zn]|uniref:RNA helicase n=1 Tax=Oidiodendron maius (strain Zn) TaxID=913774 RepID=A0A0C3D0G7_OIDMZ|nr:hypothetical protein OIDMADRAFT_157006 [Oidiodendron maius Zn]
MPPKLHTKFDDKPEPSASKPEKSSSIQGNSLKHVLEDGGSDLSHTHVAKRARLGILKPESHTKVTPSIQPQKARHSQTKDTTSTQAQIPGAPEIKKKVQNLKPNGVHQPNPQLLQKAAKELEKVRKQLPIWSKKADIRWALRNNDVLLLNGETGSGKSTQTPQFLYSEPWCKKRTVKVKSKDERDEEVSVGGVIAVTEPRRVAATTLARRVAREMGSYIGKGTGSGPVGYAVRFDSYTPKGMKIKFVTEGMLLQEMLHDPHLRQYSAVIVDEIHERSVDVDLIAGFLRKLIHGDKRGRGGIPLKVVIMSATLDLGGLEAFFSKPEALSNYKPVAVEYVEGRQYDVNIFYEVKPSQDYFQNMLQTILKLHTTERLPGDILAFLTGQEEIDTMQTQLEQIAANLVKTVPRMKVMPLYGALSGQAQQDAFEKVKEPFTRKIVLATNIAETSVTVSGVHFVVDCGKSKVKQYRPQLGMESLLAKPISKVSAIQRAGRAGRETTGKCFRIYTEEDFTKLEMDELPEILRSDVVEAVLKMKACGVDNVLDFPLMDSPDIKAMEIALVQLHIMGALDEAGNLTGTGDKMARYPLPAAYGRVIIAAAESDCLLDTIDIISCLTSDTEVFLQPKTEEDQEAIETARTALENSRGDILTYLETVHHYTAENADRNDWCQKRLISTRSMKMAMSIRRQLRQICFHQKLIAELPPPDPQPVEEISPERAEIILKTFLKAFGTRTAVLGASGYHTTQGHHEITIHPSSVLYGKKVEAIMFLDNVYTAKNYAKKVSAIQANWIVEALEI